MNIIPFLTAVVESRDKKARTIVRGPKVQNILPPTLLLSLLTYSDTEEIPSPSSTKEDSCYKHILKLLAHLHFAVCWIFREGIIVLAYYSHYHHFLRT